MTCPKCDGKTQVIDSRKISVDTIHRRRRCKACGYRFSTEEMEVDGLDRVGTLATVQQLKTKALEASEALCKAPQALEAIRYIVSLLETMEGVPTSGNKVD